MEVHVRDDSKLVEIWLTNAERQDELLQEKLKPLYRQYKNKKYLVAVFLSGEADLYEKTQDLLLYNRRRFAEKEARQEQQMDVRM